MSTASMRLRGRSAVFRIYVRCSVSVLLPSDLRILGFILNQVET